MKNLRRILVLVLLVAVLASAFGMQAFAAGTRNPEAYLPYSPYAAYGDEYRNCYVSFGDSISAGYDRYENRECIGYKPTPATSYPSIVADTLHCWHYPASFIGYRTTELMASLGVPVENPDLYHTTGYYWLYSEDGLCHYWDQAQPITLRDGVAYASLMTINVGNNDVLTAPLSLAAVDVLEAAEKYQENEETIAAAIESGELCQTLASMYQLMNQLGYYKEYIPAVLARMEEGLQNIKANMPKIVERLRSVNTTGQIAIIGMYNPYDEMTLTDSGLIKIGKMGQIVCDRVNAYYKEFCEETGCVYVDVTDTESYADLNPTNMLAGLGEDAHPTHKGHAYMAKQILDAIPVILPYTDVAEEAWYRDSVDYCYRNTLMLGTAPDTFAPDEYMSRAMVATVLWRLAGSPAAEGELPFADVEQGSWYYDAVNWAYQNGIVKGVGFNRFAPDRDVSRQDFTVMLYRYAKLEGLAGQEGSFNLLERFGFKDLRSAAKYSLESLSWAWNNGILNGVNSTQLDPTGRLTRAQCAALIMRFDKNIYTTGPVD